MERITDPAKLDENKLAPNQRQLFEKAQALAKERAANSSSSSSTASTFDQAKAEADARAAAESAGKQIFTGKVVIKDATSRMQELGRTGAIDTRYGNPTYAYLELYSAVTATAKNPDGATNKREPYRTHNDVDSILLGSNSSTESSASAWEAYEGQEITIACTQDEMSFFSDALGALFGAKAKSPEIIAPLTEASMKSATSSASSGDYVLPDTSTRTYSRSELEPLDNHTLFLARNEIYARHGRKFKSTELQEYFGSKSWYKPSIEADAFTDSMLTSTELANARLMRDIEAARGSEYL